MITWLKDKYYWFENYKTLKTYLSNRKESKVLLFGYPKSGNTWLRFLLYNYRTLLLNPKEKETITYDRLNALQNNIMDRGTIFSPEEGFPLFYRTHKIYKKTYNLFEKKIFIHRNPLDTLISAYYFYKEREEPFLDDPKNIRRELHDIDFYVSYKIDSWIKFYNRSIKYADLIMNYTKMRRYPEKSFIKLISFLDWDFDAELVRKSIELSSFEEVKKMSEEKKQKYGNGPKDGKFKGIFARSGKEAQFKYELKKETINLVLERFPRFKHLYPNLIE
tara:strand:- start:589 stop:1416 length:828 start_codon:yes stop_codon:yes gene_type:complete